MAGAIQILQTRSVTSPAQEGDRAIVPAPPDSVAWARTVLSRSMFGAGYAVRPFGPGDLVTRGAASALIASLMDQTPGMRVTAPAN